jgi:site-specific DNA recombinase
MATWTPPHGIKDQRLTDATDASIEKQVHYSAVTYARVSTDDQVQGFSLDQQIETCRHFIQQRGWRPVWIYREEGQSGATLERKQLDRLLTHAEKGLFNIVVVYRLDRISRSNLDSQILKEFFQGLDISLVSATEPFDMSTPNGRLVFDMSAALAEWERGIIRERTRAGTYSRAKIGLWHGGRSPLGYTYEPKNGIHRGQLTINVREAVQVRRIFEAFLRLGSIGATVRLVKKEGLDLGGRQASKPTIRQILCNELYEGTIELGGVRFLRSELTIIHTDLFNRVQQKLERIGECQIATFARKQSESKDSIAPL